MSSLSKQRLLRAANGHKATHRVPEKGHKFWRGIVPIWAQCVSTCIQNRSCTFSLLSSPSFVLSLNFQL